ncbi:MAG: hypothetical protein A3J79_01235 [Elusimicrobia bacterium RIFOXYB2_FULL_62_6]|nr:MAG: hypothetical protein A3J79_01235 [Elusimicrobia bacterium RIFOXYB2_FULL_62_6]
MHEHHEHGHEHHEHEHDGHGERGPIKAAFFITAFIALVEIVGGLLTGSISLLSDSLHMLTDVTGLGISLLASRMASLSPDDKRSFGYRRIEVVAALANALLLWVVSGYMLREVYARFLDPVPVLSKPMLIVAAIGLVANMICAKLLHGHAHGNINVRGAFLHVLSDMAGSVGVIAAGLVIHFTGYYRADTIVSLAIIALILYSSTRLMLETFHILMQSVPPGIAFKEVEGALKAIEGVEDVHELHIWSLTSGFDVLSAHLVVKDKDAFGKVLKAATCAMECRFSIKHCAFQIESEPVENSSCDVCRR